MKDTQTTSPAASASQSAAPAKRRWRLQFSLATLLCATLLAGTVVLFVLVQPELNRLREENKNLKVQVGVITVLDPDKIHVLPLKMLNDKMWRWRIFIPDHPRFLIYYSASVPNTGFPRQDGSTGGFALPCTGQFTLDLALSTDSHGDWQFALGVPGDRLGPVPILGEGNGKWLNEGFDSSWWTYDHPQIFEKHQPVQLLKLRQPKRNQDPVPGLMIWIEEKAEKP